MNNTLYEITDKYLKVLDNLEIDEETGEILNAEELDELSGAFEEKSEAVACYIKNSEVFIGDLKAEEANLAKRRKQTEKRIDYLKNVLTACLDAAGRDKVETTKVRVSFRKSVAVAKAHENAVKHGFWEPPLPFGTAIALIHSELSEALEEERNGNPDIWFACNESDNFICTPQDETECLMYGKESLCKYRSRKPEGVAVELADAVIRIADLCGHLGIDLEEVIEIKMAYNEGRPYKHGKKF